MEDHCPNDTLCQRCEAIVNQFLEQVTRKIIYAGRIVDARMPSCMTRSILKEHCAGAGIMMEDKDGKPDYSTICCASCGFKLDKYFMDLTSLEGRKPFDAQILHKNRIEAAA